MVWADGVLYQASLRGIVAKPDDNPEATVLVRDAPATAVWVEGDTLVFTDQAKLMSVPRNGGATTVLLDSLADTHPETVGRTYVAPFFALDGTAFCWTTVSYTPSEGAHVWRMLRATGKREELAGVPLSAVLRLSLGANGLVLAGQSSLAGAGFYSAFVVPLDQTEARTIPLVPAPDGIIGAEEAAIIGTVYDAGPPDFHEVRVFPTDGSASRVLASNLPGEFLAIATFVDGPGSRWLVGVEAFDDRKSHTSVFKLGADGKATRVACDPSDHWPLFRSKALAPDAVYLAFADSDPSGWKLIRLSTP
jgi:hypothetical protein